MKTQNLAKELIELTKELRKLKSLEFMQVFKNPWKFMWFSFLKGLMVGFGSVLGASVLVAIFIYLIAQLSDIPVLGGYVKDVANEINIKSNTLTNEK